MAKGKILLLETSTTLAKAVNLTLKGSDYLIKKVVDPDTTIQEIELFTPDFIIAEMRALSPELTAALRELAIPLVYSIKTDESPFAPGTFLPRPFSSQELLDLIEKLHSEPQSFLSDPQAAVKEPEETALLEDDSETSAETESLDDLFGQDDEPLIIERGSDSWEEEEPVVLMPDISEPQEAEIVSPDEDDTDQPMILSPENNDEEETPDFSSVISQVRSEEDFQPENELEKEFFSGTEENFSTDHTENIEEFSKDTSLEEKVDTVETEKAPLTQPETPDENTPIEEFSEVPDLPELEEIDPAFATEEEEEPLFGEQPSTEPSLEQTEELEHNQTEPSGEEIEPLETIADESDVEVIKSDEIESVEEVEQLEEIDCQAPAFDQVEAADSLNIDKVVDNHEEVTEIEEIGSIEPAQSAPDVSPLPETMEKPSFPEAEQLDNTTPEESVSLFHEEAEALFSEENSPDEKEQEVEELFNSHQSDQEQLSQVEAKANNDIFEITADDLLDPFSTNQPVSNASVDPAELRKMIKKELHTIMQEVFWEEAPSIVQDILEKQISHLAQDEQQQ